MPDAREYKTSCLVRTHLRHARDALPEPRQNQKPEFGRLLREHQKLLDDNELELALDTLGQLGALVPCRGAFWRDLERAAATMELTDRIPYFREQLSAALDRVQERTEPES